MKNNRERYYKTFEDDFFEDGKEHIIKENYRWIRSEIFSRFLSALIYTLALIFSNIYCRIFLNVRFVGREKLKTVKGGYFVYGNHTQPVGDVFNPALACFPKRIYTVVSPANMDLAVIGKILPFLGALPIPHSFSGMKAFTSALEYRIETGHPVIIYPEARVWEYFTKIRSFDDTSFKYPVKLGVASFCMTATYQKRKHCKKPRITIFIDGPFYPSGETAKEKAQSLHTAVSEAMQNRSEASNCEYIKYIKTD